MRLLDQKLTREKKNIKRSHPLPNQSEQKKKDFLPIPDRLRENINEKQRATRGIGEPKERSLKKNMLHSSYSYKDPPGKYKRRSSARKPKNDREGYVTKS